MDAGGNLSKIHQILMNMLSEKRLGSVPGCLGSFFGTILAFRHLQEAVLRGFLGSPRTLGRVSGGPERVHGVPKAGNALIFATSMV